MRRLAFATALLAAALVTACGGDDDEPAEPVATGASVTGFAFTGGGVADGQPIDPRYTCDGDDVSPALAWAGVPAGTAELALVVEDPDAPGGTFTHWLVYGVDPSVTALPEGVPVRADVAGPPALRQGVNDMGAAGYGGPCPPGGEEHRYVFRLLALDEALGLPDGVSRDDVLGALAGRVLAEARLTATYAHTVG
ncbi:MAG TPA: YbhB/YbcL family Raf kinase inhibitor-like protein [Gaiellaceae bacterium]|jgi:Raf kinase inhibitor-like YbhB/YbcL family protein